MMQPLPRIPADAEALARGLQYLADALRTRLGRYFGHETAYPHLEAIPVPLLEGLDGSFVSFVRAHNLSPDELLLLLLALAPHVDPGLLDRLVGEAMPEPTDFPQMGGMRGSQFRGFIPTAETALFLLAGTDLQRRFDVLPLLGRSHFLCQQGVLTVEEAKAGEPSSSGRLALNPEYVELFTTGVVAPPVFSMAFPAKRISTALNWEDLVLPAKTMAEVRELEHWIEHGAFIRKEWEMSARIKPGFRVLFYGPPGTGKTLAAGLLGKYTDRPVYRVDLSMVVSKFIGETEKNLARLFQKAERKEWILFFDEADSLFGKRTGVRDAHDKYANQEVAYLLQRVEDYDGLVILASNFKANIDDAFMRRFQSIVHFPFPDPPERLALWQKAVSPKVNLEASVDLANLARRYELTGANINNVVQFAALKARSRGKAALLEQDLLAGIKREFFKEGKVQ